MMKDDGINGSMNAGNAKKGPGQDIFEKTLHLVDREEESFARLQRLIAKLGIVNPTIYDVGANVGQSIEKFRRVWPEAEIHSFEPNPPTFAALASKWGNTRGIVLNNVALSDSVTTTPFHATRVSEIASLLSPTERMRAISTEHKYDYELIQIQTEMLDNYCLKSNCAKLDILKIDVQGAELAVLKGSRAQLQRGLSSAIYVETTFADCYEGQTSYSDLLAYLNLFGYQLWDIAPFLYTRRDRIWAANSIFLSKAASATLEK